MSKFELQADSVEEVLKKKPKKEAVKESSDKEEIISRENNFSEEENVVSITSKPKTTRKRKKLEEMTPSEQIALHAQRNTYSVQKASKVEKEELYQQESVFVEDGDELAILTDSARRREEWLDIVAASQDDARMLTGTIVSITEIESNSKDEPGYIPEYMAKVRYKTGQFQINIPSYVLYYYHYENMNPAMAHDIQKNMLRRMGSEVKFCVRYCDEATGMVIGDRLQALSMRGVANYTSIRGAKPKIIPGMIVQGTITAISRNYITVDCAGAEIRVPIEEISWLYVDDARLFDGVKTKECYKIGSKVLVKILTAEANKVKIKNSTYTLIMATGSIKQAQRNPRIKYFDEFKPGDMYAGTITGIEEAGVYVNIDNRMDCLCKLPTDRTVFKGESVIVSINSRDEEKKFIYGKIR